MSKYKWISKEEKELIAEMRDHGETIKYIAFKLGRSPVSVCRVSKRKTTRRWTEEEKKEVHRLADEGIFYSEIGRRFGRSRAAIAHFLSGERRKESL